MNPTGSGAETFLSMARACLETTGRFLERHRFRLAGTPECRNAAHDIAAHFRETCDSVREEAFRLHPKALWYVGKVIAVAYLLGAASVFLGGYFLYVGAVLVLLSLVYSLVQYVFYGRLFDRVFKGAAGGNVIGVLEPGEAVRQQVVLVGHHDSPYIFNFLERFQSLAFLRFLLGMLSFAWICVYCLTAAVPQWRTGVLRVPTGIPLWITIAGLPFALSLFFMMSRAPSPGAGDNLNSIFMAAEIAGFFRAARSHGSPLRQTRLVLLSTDGEEIGQRGAGQFARSRKAEFHAIPTFVFNIDSIYRLADLKLLTRDRNFLCGLSGAMITDIRAVAGALGVSLKKGPIPFGGGGTDAAPFAAAGIPAASLIGMPTSFISKGHLYHTSKDTIEHIEVEAVRAVLELAAGYIRNIDNRAGEPSKSGS